MHGMVKEWNTYDRKYRHTHKHTILLRMCTQARHNYAMFVGRFHCILNKCAISSGMQQVIRQMYTHCKSNNNKNKNIEPLK